MCKTREGTQLLEKLIEQITSFFKKLYSKIIHIKDTKKSSIMSQDTVISENQTADSGSQTPPMCRAQWVLKVTQHSRILFVAYPDNKHLWG